ncbi:MAG: HD-GYP domain-containing protein [Desulfobacter sp.]|nr:MAG: HD-GYP domain-containing protein [Desulfobacter sp.]
MKDNEAGQSKKNIAARVLHQFSESLGNAIDAKDPFTRLHSEEVAEVAHAIALAMGLDPADADLIHVAGHLHDIGKIGVPDHILQKKGPLTDGEWAFIRRHPDMGADILRPVEALSQSGIVDMVRHHHERFDGAGYPAGLKGKEIPLGARIISLADSLSAILQNRPYRPARVFDEAVEEIINCSGTQFDPRVVTAFLRVQDKIRSIIRFLGPCRLDVA